MKYFILLLIVLLYGCGMTIDDIIKEINKCKKAGLNHKEYVDPNTKRTTFIVCTSG